ncbi:hypothetical protein T459_35676 [Capsicum annuum]|uniref:CCHC-type domain-containing protein n=1 Tax=Capsicum annuum TaxID=4072 RepID=A0A2G2VWP1_CAPAN|nr:hypothetical protein T459_35676 [Capsicum annuum]
MCFPYFGDRLREYVVHSAFFEQGKSCFICKKGGHRANVCPERGERGHGGSKSSKICLKCGDSGHDMFSCKNNYAGDDLKVCVAEETFNLEFYVVLSEFISVPFLLLPLMGNTMLHLHEHECYLSFESRDVAGVDKR